MESHAVRVETPPLITRVRHRGLRIAVGLLLNTVIVSTPLAFVSAAGVAALPVMLLFAGSALICASEMNRTIDKPDHLKGFGAYHYAALAGALLLLLLQWGSLVEFLLIGNGADGTSMAIGITLVVAGCLLRSAAIRKLDDGFCSNPSTEQFVTCGIYSTMRHPSETGLLLASAGLPIIVGSWWTAIIILPVSLAAAMFRIGLEERSLLAKFGDEYNVYRRRVGRWLPGRAKSSKT